MAWRRRRGSSGHRLDDQLLAELGRRTDLTQPRHWVHFLYVADEDVAIATAAKVSAAGWHIQRISPSAGEGETTWVVVAERKDVVISAEGVTQARAYFEALAEETPGGEYDGWEASV